MFAVQFAGIQYTLTMNITLFYLIAASLLCASGVLAGLAVFSNNQLSIRFLPVCMGLGLLVSGFLLYGQLFRSTGFHFGFTLGLACVVWLAAVMAFIESFFKPFRLIDLIIFPLAALFLILLIFFPENDLVIQGRSWLFGTHVVLAVFAHSLLGIAVLHSAIMAWLEGSIQHAARLSQQQNRLIQVLFDQMPSLLALEATLFRQIQFGFVLLSLALFTGFFIGSTGAPWYLEHKTVLSMLAWVVFAVLLVGRLFMGWRGRRAMYGCLVGYAMLLLAYFGTQFVLQFVLLRAS